MILDFKSYPFSFNKVLKNEGNTNVTLENKNKQTSYIQ